jgi:glycosyltransferase involved in cell wall biosynthesis
MSFGAAMNIGIYAEDLGAYTSSTSSRDMLRALMTLRSRDHFHLVVRRPTDRHLWWREYLGTLPAGCWSAFVEPRRRRTVNLLALAGLRAANAVRATADLFIRLSPGILGPRSQPLIGLVADLSSIRTPSECSVPWHGRRLARRQLPWMARMAAAIVTISEFTRLDLLDWDPSLKDRVTVVHNGLGAPWLRQAAAAGPSAILAETRYWIWYGQITPRKNISRLLAAYARLGRELDLPRLRLVTVPPQPIADQVRRLNLADRVTFTPPLPVEELVSAVAGSCGLLFPSLYEGFGMPIAEAMVCGVPVLTSDRTAMPEVAGGLAELCNPENADSIASGMRALLAPAQLHPAAAARRKAWASHFTADRAARAYSAIIDRVGNHGHARL